MADNPRTGPDQEQLELASFQVVERGQDGLQLWALDVRGRLWWAPNVWSDWQPFPGPKIARDAAGGGAPTDPRGANARNLPRWHVCPSCGTWRRLESEPLRADNPNTPGNPAGEEGVR